MIRYRIKVCVFGNISLFFKYLLGAFGFDSHHHTYYVALQFARFNFFLLLMPTRGPLARPAIEADDESCALAHARLKIFSKLCPASSA